MEPTTETESQAQYHEPDMILSQQTQYDLQQAGKWAKFIAIMGFIFCGFILLIALFAGTFITILAKFSHTPGPIGMIGPLIGIPYLVIAVVAFFLNYNLYLFGVRVEKGIAFINNEMVASGLGKMKSYFKMKGIILIIVLVLYVLIFMITIVAGIGASFIMPGNNI